MKDSTMIVQIYGMIGCDYCEKAIDLAEEYELPYIYNELDEDFRMDEFNVKFPTATTFPQIVINGIHIGGYSDFEEVMEMASE